MHLSAAVGAGRVISILIGILIRECALRAFLFAECQFCVKLIKGVGARCFEFITPPRVNTFQVERKIYNSTLFDSAAALAISFTLAARTPPTNI